MSGWRQEGNVSIVRGPRMAASQIFHSQMRYPLGHWPRLWLHSHTQGQKLNQGLCPTPPHPVQNPGHARWWHCHLGCHSCCSGGPAEPCIHGCPWQAPNTTPKCLKGWPFGAWKCIEKRITNTPFIPLGLRNRMSQQTLPGGTVFVSFHKKNCCLKLGVYHLHECVYFYIPRNSICSYWTTYIIMNKCVCVCCMYMWVQARGQAWRISPWCLTHEPQGSMCSCYLNVWISTTGCYA